MSRFVDRDTWIAARKALLAKEKALTHQREALSEVRRNLPLVRIDKPYVFETERGHESLADLFKGRSQLIVQHFMFGADWDEGCPSCSFWVDNFNGIQAHLAARDTSFVLISAAALQKLTSYKRRLGWSVDWVSSAGTDFNHDFGVSFPDGAPGPMQGYNYAGATPPGEMPGLSTFKRFEDGAVGHLYSTYGRGLDMLNGAYQLIDLTPKGRDEADLPFPQAWVRRRDSYDGKAN